MGHATSSALRADDAAQADAFGSLSSLGGPRKFKKKPVLVLAPEELEEAHRMFHDASAEMLGQELERPARPSGSLLGLAPMDDDDAAPEDMGEDGDETFEDEAEMPVAPKDMLGLERARGMDVGGGNADLDIDDMAAQQLDQGLDMERRIFPSLPVHQEEPDAVPEIEPEKAAASPVNEDDDWAAETPPVGSTEDKIEIVAKSVDEPSALDRVMKRVPPAPMQPPAGDQAMPLGKRPATPEPVAAEDIHPPTTPESETPARHIAPLREATPAVEPSNDVAKDAAPVWDQMAEPAERPEFVPATNEPAYEPEPAPETSASYTEIEEEEIDGYAFMQSQNPREHARNVAAGQGNSLRARLIREAETAQAEAAEHERSPSLLRRVFGWLGRLFG